METKTIKAIETRYRGYNFRSRLEARWAVFFDSMGIEFEYEQEGFSLPSGPYLPDFWIPQVKMWAEVKPADPSPEEVSRCLDLERATGKRCLILTGPPDFRLYFSAAYFGDEGNCCDDYLLTTDYLDEHRFFSGIGSDDPYSLSDSLKNDKRYALAVFASRSARFEYGQSGET